MKYSKTAIVAAVVVRFEGRDRVVAAAGMYTWCTVRLGRVPWLELVEKLGLLSRRQTRGSQSDINLWKPV